MVEYETICNVGIIVFAVGHKDFYDMNKWIIEAMFTPENLKNTKKFIFDVKSILKKEDIEMMGWEYWTL